MRVNERQQILQDTNAWSSICEQGYKQGLLHKDILVNGDIRYIAVDAKGIAHGDWLIHSITISVKPWACISDNVEYVAKKAADKRAFDLRLALKYGIKPLLELTSLNGAAVDKFNAKAALSGEEFIHLLRMNDIDIPLKTWGFINKNLVSIKRTAAGYSYQNYGAKYRGQTLFDLYTKLEAHMNKEVIDDSYCTEEELAHLFKQA